MPILEDGFKLNLDNYTDATDGVNYCLVLTDVYSNAYNLVATTEAVYTASTYKVDLTVGDTNPTASDVEAIMEAQAGTYYGDWIGETLTDTTIFRVDDGVGYTYWKAYYPTKKAITFASATGTEFGGSVSASNLPLTFSITGGQTVQAIGLYHGVIAVAYIDVADVTDVNDYQYLVDTALFNVT